MFDARKYAISMRQLDFGIWGYPKGIFYAIHLTTREGDDNSTNERYKV